MDDGKRYTEYGLLGALAIGLAAGLLAGMAIYAAAYPAFQSSEWAAWVQAVGSIGAVLGAIWISNRNRSEQVAEEKRKSILMQEQVGFEVANLAYDVTQFLVRTSDTDQSKRPRYFVDEAEFNELLERMSWVRRTAKSALDLEDVRTLRSNLVETTALFRINSKWERSIPKEETDSMESGQKECARVSERRSDQRGKYSGLT